MFENCRVLKFGQLFVLRSVQVPGFTVYTAASHCGPGNSFRSCRAMTAKFLLFSLALAAAVTVKYVQDRLAGWALPPGYTFNDGSCELAGAGQGAEQGAVMVGSEDMAMGRHGLLFITRFAHIIQ